MKPVISPIYNTKPVENVFLQIASELGSPVSEVLPWNNFEDMLRYCLKGIFDSRTGLVFSGVYGKAWIESLEQSGWKYTTYDSFDDFWWLGFVELCIKGVPAVAVIPAAAHHGGHRPNLSRIECGRRDHNILVEFKRPGAEQTDAQAGNLMSNHFFCRDF